MSNPTRKVAVEPEFLKCGSPLATWLCRRKRGYEKSVIHKAKRADAGAKALGPRAGRHAAMVTPPANLAAGPSFLSVEALWTVRLADESGATKKVSYIKQRLTKTEGKSGYSAGVAISKTGRQRLNSLSVEIL